jgi:hypothetical protein
MSYTPGKSQHLVGTQPLIVFDVLQNYLASDIMPNAVATHLEL